MTTTWKVVTATRAVDHVELGGVRERRPRATGATVECSRVDRSEREPVARAEAGPGRPRRARSRPWPRAAPRSARAAAHGTTSITSRSRVQKTASIENRMKNMWIDPPGRKSIPSSGSSDARPSRPFMRGDRRDREPTARTHDGSVLREKRCRLHRTREHRASRQRGYNARPPADVAELVDAHGSGPCARKGVEVQVLSSA